MNWYCRSYTGSKVSLDRETGLYDVKAAFFALRTEKGETMLSYTRPEGGERFDFETMNRYQNSKKLPSGDLPGVVEFVEELFTESEIDVPRYDEDKKDVDFGHLHYSTPELSSTDAQELADAITAALNEKAVTPAMREKRAFIRPFSKAKRS